MKNLPEVPAVVCYGEVLWDVAPTKATPGGAPMNVAYHLQQFGSSTTLISRIGADEQGEQLLEHLQRSGLSTSFCQTDSTHATSEVHVRIAENNEVSYDILYPVAWDFIQYQEAQEPLVRQADAFVFGSLVSRNEASYSTLLQLLQLSGYNVFDVNLREPHYTPDKLKQLLTYADLVKLNEAELELITDWFKPGLTTETDRIKLLQEKFALEEVLVTKGSKGASFYFQDEHYFQKAFPIQVADTIGSGDSFLAAFLAHKLRHAPPATCLAYAAALAAFVTMHHGACPPYTLQTLENFKQEKEKQQP
ncbi:carbohydrate kinase [Pontibacter qinzhouensis]|uniref:Carbohydrate kinase n=1 Tax=Pontibacter qinzhouensis TaxID=2603253 RepID=A0A5C8K765_9BACT|nr:carbohydrate kinase [Pontibacter qinzhouensis]TXK48064.1 carbohydrate kinase [Pontibacter qinzhouensis]